MIRSIASSFFDGSRVKSDFPTKIKIIQRETIERDMFVATKRFVETNARNKQASLTGRPTTLEQRRSFRPRFGPQIFFGGFTSTRC